MTTITIWLLVSYSTFASSSFYSGKIEQFATSADCQVVADQINKPLSRGGVLCIRATVVR
jgi:hypothetical protein